MSENLQEQLQKIENELEQERQRGSERDAAKIAGLEKQQAEIREQMRNEQHEERVQQAEEDIAYVLDNLTVDDVDDKTIYMRDLCISEKHYQLLRIRVQQAFVAQAAEGSKLLKTAEAEYQEQLRAGQERESQLRRQLEQVTIERDDLSRSRDNAAEQVAEGQTEIARLNSHVIDLQGQLALGARNSIKVVTSEEQKQQIENLAKQIHDDKTRVTNMRYKDEIKKQSFLAERADNGETIEIPWMEKGKYIDLTPEQVERFRAEHANENHTLDSIPTTIDAPALDATIDYFPSAGESVDGESETVREAADGDDLPVTRAEIVEIVNRVAALEEIAKIGPRWLYGDGGAA